MDYSYEAWVAPCFAHPVQDPAWHVDADAPEWSAHPAVTLAHLTRFFARSSAALTPYSDAQIDQGLWYIAEAFSPFDAALPSADRVACVSAMAGLYDDLYALRCAPTWGHASDGPGGERPLNSACYMSWDILRVAPLLRDPLRAAIDEAAVTVMGHALTLESIACRESDAPRTRPLGERLSRRSSGNDRCLSGKGRCAACLETLRIGRSWRARALKDQERVGNG